MAYLNTDVPELFGSDTSLCLKNLDILGVRQNRVTESMLAVLSELADAILRDSGGDPETVDSILLSLNGMTEDRGDGENGEGINERIREQIAPVNRALIGRISRHAGLHMRLILYRLMADRAAGSEKHHRVQTLSPLPEAARGRIAYMGGAFADKAYARLSAEVSAARAATFHSFVDACEEVHGGLCEYCILPLENTQSGTLIAFSRLILRYSLHIMAVCDLENGMSPGQFTRFGLLRRASDSDIAPSPSAVAPQYIELLHTTESPSLTELLDAAAFCGLRPVRLHTLPRFEELQFLLDETADGYTPPTGCVLEATGADLVTFRRFLALETPDNILMGQYSIMKN